MDFTSFSIDTDYVMVIEYFYEQRKLRMPKYSLRKYANDLGLSSSRLSQILLRKYGLSKKAAESICDKLNLHPLEKEIFCHLVALKHSRSHKQKSEAVKFFKNIKFHQTHLENEAFKLISQWHYLAILELVHLLGPKFSINLVSRRLGLDIKKAQAAMDSLINLGYLKRISKNHYARGANYYIPGDTTKKDAAAKKYLQEVTRRLPPLLSLHDESSNKYALSAVVALNEEDYKYFKNEIVSFFSKLNKDIEERPSKKEQKLYYINTYFLSAEVE